MGKKKTVNKKPKQRSKQKSNKNKFKSVNTVVNNGLVDVKPVTQINSLRRNKVYADIWNRSLDIVDDITDSLINIHRLTLDYIDTFLNNYHAVLHNDFNPREGLGVIITHNLKDVYKFATEVDTNVFMLRPDCPFINDEHIKDLNIYLNVDKHIQHTSENIIKYDEIKNARAFLSFDENDTVVTNFISLVFKNEQAYAEYKNNKFYMHMNTYCNIVSNLDNIIDYGKYSFLAVSEDELRHLCESLDDTSFLNYVETKNETLVNTKLADKVSMYNTILQFLHRKLPKPAEQLEKALKRNTEIVLLDVAKTIQADLEDSVSDFTSDFEHTIYNGMLNKECIYIEDYDKSGITIRRELTGAETSLEEINSDINLSYTKEGLTYIDNYKVLNSLANKAGFSLIRHNGDHGIFRNSDGFVVVIPQGRTIGKGLSLLIQKSIKESANYE